MSKAGNFKIDIDAILEEKAPKLYKKTAKFLIKCLKRIIHQDGINGILERNSELQGVEFMQAVVEKEFQLTLEVKGEENIPENGRFVFVSNHPLGGLDGICLSALIGKKFDGKIKYLVNDLLYYLEPLKPIFVPINKYGSQAKESVKAINETYASDQQIITFPAGLCSRKIGEEIIDLKWMKSFVAKSIEYQRDIIPIFFEGENSNFFYNFANIRNSLGIKVNIEQIFLPREMFKNSNQKFKISFGKPISWESLNRDKTTAQWAEHIKEIVYSLKSND